MARCTTCNDSGIDPFPDTRPGYSQRCRKCGGKGYDEGDWRAVLYRRMDEKAREANDPPTFTRIAAKLETAERTTFSHEALVALQADMFFDGFVIGIYEAGVAAYVARAEAAEKQNAALREDVSNILDKARIYCCADDWPVALRFIEQARAALAEGKE